MVHPYKSESCKYNLWNEIYTFRNTVKRLLGNIIIRIIHTLYHLFNYLHIFLLQFIIIFNQKDKLDEIIFKSYHIYIWIFVVKFASETDKKLSILHISWSSLGSNLNSGCCNGKMIILNIRKTILIIFHLPVVMRLISRRGSFLTKVQS